MQDSEELERNQLHEYSTFEDQGLNAPIPEGYTKIPTHFVYDVKHDGRHQSRMVAGGHRTEMPVDSVYAGVVTLAGVRIVTFLAEHNDMEPRLFNSARNRRNPLNPSKSGSPGGISLC
jgi:hypothetical protein